MAGTCKDIVIVGGGGAGLMLVRALLPRLDSKKHSLTLINPRPFYVHLPRTVRMAVDSCVHPERRVLRSLEDQFEGAIKDFAKLKIGWAVRVEGDAEKKGGHVALGDGERVHYDALVLAPGLRLDDPLAYPDDLDDAKAYIDNWRAKFKNAEHIVFGGGGPVSVEIAGEIKYLYPNKSVTIVQSRSLPFNAVYNDSFRKRALKVCKSIGIDFVLENYLDATEPTNGTVMTRKGETLRADVVVHATGGTPATDFVRSLGPTAVNERGMIPVAPTLELPDHPGVFCIGDVLDNAERPRLKKYKKHVAVVVDNLLARLDGKKPTKVYGGSDETISISIGKGHKVKYIDVLGGIVRSK